MRLFADSLAPPPITSFAGWWSTVDSWHGASGEERNMVCLLERSYHLQLNAYAGWVGPFSVQVDLKVYSNELWNELHQPCTANVKKCTSMYNKRPEYTGECQSCSKRKFKHCVLNFHLVWNTSIYERLYVCIFVFVVLFCSSLGSRSERPRALQLLIKMLIRWCLMWEGLILLYRNFLFNLIFQLLFRFSGTGRSAYRWGKLQVTWLQDWKTSSPRLFVWGSRPEQIFGCLLCAHIDLESLELVMV